jgi:uncharacterized protein
MTLHVVVIAAMALLLPASLAAQSRGTVPAPIIDMHLHASAVADFQRLIRAPLPIPHCVPMTAYAVPSSGAAWLQAFSDPRPPCTATLSGISDEDVMQKTLAIMQQRNIIGFGGGVRIERWLRTAPSRILPTVDEPGAVSIDSLRTLLTRGGYKGISEWAPQYAGLEPGDSSLAPIWALAEELDIPVGIHIGTGPVGAPYLGFSRYRGRLHSPLLLEEVLVKHPRLRVYIMHAGWPMIDDLLAVLWTHPHVYVDIGVLDWAVARPEFHRYLQRIVEAGFGKRVLFGSDNMIWPETVKLALEGIETATFLTAEQKRDILYNNAARFLRLTQAEIDRHHGR